MNLTRKKLLYISIFASFILSLGFCINVYATNAPTYTALSPIPGLTDTNVQFDSNGTNPSSGSGLSKYISGLYQWGVALTSGLAVLVIMWGGVGYMTSAGGSGIEEAKGRISAALMGLLLALGSYIILQTINKDLLKTTFDLKTLDYTSTATTNNSYVSTSGGTSIDPITGAVISGNAGSNYYYTSDQFGGSNQNIPVTNDVGTTDKASSVFQYALSANGTPTYDGQTIIATNPAVDTDGTGNPGFDNAKTADGRPQHQSVTSYQVNGKSLDATTDNYVAVPTSAKIPTGTPVLITDTTTGKQVQAISGDNGATGYGEMSVHAAKDLGIWRDGMGNSVDATGHKITYTIGRPGNISTD